MILTILVCVTLMFYVAYRSGEHHAERAKRIVERNRVERKRKWYKQELKIKGLEMDNRNLRKLVKEIM